MAEFRFKGWFNIFDKALDNVSQEAKIIIPLDLPLKLLLLGKYRRSKVHLPGFLKLTDPLCIYEVTRLIIFAVCKLLNVQGMCKK
jgi:hypothetical protein